MPSVNIPINPETSRQNCQCGCAPCRGQTCGLDCLVQPRFFCGQLLTDQDLTALLSWTQAKFRLGRYRQGWGVVCGLDVQADSKHPGQVIIQPGYAINCCGDDIVVCAPTNFDLSEACRPEKDPCAELRPKPGSELPSALEQFFGSRLATSDEEPSERGTTRLVDLYIRYEEKLSEPQTALVRGNCTQVGECEFSRTQESFALSYQLTTGENNPQLERVRHWREGYAKAIQIIEAFRRDFSTAKYSGQEGQRWLLRWLQHYPLQHFSGLAQALRTLNPEILQDEIGLTELLFWLAQDYRLRYLQCACFGCEDNSGVPLARVWLQEQSNGCQIIAIDSYSPFRRPIGPECWPARMGEVNLAQFIWQRWEEAYLGLAQLGLSQVNSNEIGIPTSLNELSQLMYGDFFATPGSSVTAQVYQHPELGPKVVGFTVGQQMETSVAEYPAASPAPAPEEPIKPGRSGKSRPSA